METTSSTTARIGVAGWVRSVPAAVRMLLGGRIRFRRDRLGRPLTMHDGRSYVPFRETVAVTPASGTARATLQARFRLPLMPPRARIRHAIFRRLCIVTVPFFCGLPGFRSKLWMVDPGTGDFAGLYAWDGTELARAYAEGLVVVLRMLSVPGSVSYELTPATTVDQYLAGSRRDGRPATAA